MTGRNRHLEGQLGLTTTVGAQPGFAWLWGCPCETTQIFQSPAKRDGLAGDTWQVGNDRGADYSTQDIEVQDGVQQRENIILLCGHM